MHMQAFLKYHIYNVKSIQKKLYLYNIFLMNNSFGRGPGYLNSCENKKNQIRIVKITLLLTLVYKRLSK